MLKSMSLDVLQTSSGVFVLVEPSGKERLTICTWRVSCALLWPLLLFLPVVTALCLIRLARVVMLKFQCIILHLPSDRQANRVKFAAPWRMKSGYAPGFLC